MPVYQGPDSCMARREGWYVRRLRGRGVDTLKEAVALAWAVLRDYRRGYSYDDDHNCRRIKMTWELAKKRLKFIVTLAHFHGAPPRVRAKIERLIAYVLAHKRLPRTIDGKSVREIVREMIVKKRGRRR